jgi:hypothetical protein
MDTDISNDDGMKFFYLDQRLLAALKEDDIEKYLMIVKEKQMEELNQKKQLIQMEEKQKEQEELDKKEKYIEMMVKKEEELFEENRIEIQKRFDERLHQRMMYELRIMMIYKMNDSIIKLENTIKNALSITENNLKKTKTRMDTIFDVKYSKYKSLTYE